MDASSLNISLTKAQRSFVDAQVQGGGFRTASEYVRQLIRADQERQANEQDLEDALVEAVRRLESGDGSEVTPEWIARKKALLSERRGRRAS